MQRRAPIALAAALAVSGLTAAAALSAGETEDARPVPPPARLTPLEPPSPGLAMIESRSLGLPHRGRLLRGVRLPSLGLHHTTWDPQLRRLPSRWWRRYGNDYLVRMVLRVARRHAAADPEPPPPMLVGDLSRPRGGRFDRRFGALGHFQPPERAGRGRLLPPPRQAQQAAADVRQVDLRLAQRLLDLFVAAVAKTR